MKRNGKNMAAVILMMAIIAMVLTACGSNNIATVSRNTELDLNEYVRVELNGTDGYGKITGMYLDIDQILMDHQDRISAWEYQELEKTENEGTTYEFSNGNTSYVVPDCASVAYAREVVLRDLLPEMNQEPYYELKDNKYLENGTEISIEWENNDSLEENIKILEDMLGLNVAFEDFTYIIDSLPAVVEVDPLENVTFYMEGCNGEARIVSLYADSYVPTIRGNRDTQIKVHISEEDNHHLSNGDKVWVSLDGTVDEESTARKYGIKFTRTEGETEIRGLDDYTQQDA